MTYNQPKFQGGYTAYPPPPGQQPQNQPPPQPMPQMKYPVVLRIPTYQELPPMYYNPPNQPYDDGRRRDRSRSRERYRDDRGQRNYYY